MLATDVAMSTWGPSRSAKFGTWSGQVARNPSDEGPRRGKVEVDETLGDVTVKALHELAGELGRQR